MSAVTPSGGAADQPLDDVMLAMDVVDTLRRRQRLVEKELGGEESARELKERLRKIYAGQGIEVPDQVLEEGVAALREDRFVYRAPPGTLATRLANVYVSRDRWGKWLGAGVAAVLIAWGAYWYTVSAPRAALPGELQQAYQEVVELAGGDDARKRAEGLLGKGEIALREGENDGARAALQSLQQLRTLLEQEYPLRVVARPGERSGVWRVPDANPDARNYYLIVEAVDADGEVLQVPVVNEETGAPEQVGKWGLRVEKSVFQRVAADKQDDGIIQNNRVGSKRRGQLEPDYEIPTSGAVITRW